MLLALLAMVHVMPALAQSDIEPVPGTYTMNLNGKAYEVTGNALTMEFSNLAEDFYLLTLKMDQVAFVERMEFAAREAQELEWNPVEKNGKVSSQKIKWDRKSGSLELYTDENGITVMKFDDGEDTVLIIFTSEGPIISTGKSSGEKL